MSVVISSDFVMTPDGLTADHPVIGWRNIVTPSNVIPSQAAAAGFPASNLANPATFLKWKSSNNLTQTLQINTGTADLINYVALARHNLGSIGATLHVSDGVTVFIGPVILPNDGPAILRFNPVSRATLYLSITTPASPPEIAVMYIGKLLVLERRIYANHTPMPHGRTWKATDGMSESGQFLGRIVLQEFVKTKIPLSLLTPAWFRANLDPFLNVAHEIPFFFAWRPQTYPFECGYGWLTAEPAPAPTPPSNLIALTLEVSGVR